MLIKKSEYEYLQSIRNEFNKAVNDNFTPLRGLDARAEFDRRLTVGERMAMSFAEFRHNLASEGDYSPDTKAAAMMDLWDMSVPCLIRTFGEAGVLRALPERARNEETARLCDRAGASLVADLILKMVKQ